MSGAVQQGDVAVPGGLPASCAGAEDYRDARAAAELLAERASNGHEPERTDHLRRHGITFKQWLTARRGWGRRAA